MEYVCNEDLFTKKRTKSVITFEEVLRDHHEAREIKFTELETNGRILYASGKKGGPRSDEQQTDDEYVRSLMKRLTELRLSEKENERTGVE